MNVAKPKRLLTVSFSCLREYKGESIDIPYFRLSAKWLFQAGFRTGDILHVEISENNLTITNANHNLRKATTKKKRNRIHVEVPASTTNPK